MSLFLVETQAGTIEKTPSSTIGPRGQAGTGRVECDAFDTFFMDRNSKKS